MLIRNAIINDAEIIVDININGWKNTYNGIFPKEFLDSLNSKKEESIEKCKKNIEQYAVCEIDQKIVGIIRFGKNKKELDKNYGEIYALYLDEEFKYKGIGTKLVKYAFDILKTKFQFCVISTLVDNSANIFYKKLGGKLIGTSNFSIDGNNYVENIYEYELDTKN